MSRYTQYFGQNNVKSELAVGISSIATTIQVNENQGNLRGENFPVLATLEHFDSTGKVSKREIVKVVSKSGDSFTVVRKFAPCPPSDDATSQSAVSSSFDPGDSFSIYIPYEIFNAVSEAINDLYNNGNDRLFAKKTSGLGFEITPGNVRFESGEAYYQGGTGTVVDNSVNYIMLDSSFNIIITQEELLDVQNISIAEITAVNGEITQIVSRKIDSFAGRMGAGGDPVYGDGSDGDLTITENTILNAGQQYQFSNLTICAGATVSFSGSGGAKIRVANTFLNYGTITATDVNVDSYEYIDSTSFCKLCNCAWNSTFCAGKGGCSGETYTSPGGSNCRGCGGDGGCAISHPTVCQVGAGGTATTRGKGNGGTGYNCGGGGGTGGRSSCYSYIPNASDRTNGSAGSGYNGGNGGNATTGYYGPYAGGGGGGGGFYTGNGGNGGKGSVYTSCGAGMSYKTGGDGGNGGIQGNGGNGGSGMNRGSDAYGIGGNGGDGVCGGTGGPGSKGGNGGMGYYGGNGGTGYYCNCRNNSGVGGKGGSGVVPGTGGCGACRGGEGGDGLSALHSINIKAKIFNNQGSIRSVGGTGGLGGLSGASGCGGKGGNGGTGGNIQIITENMCCRGTITVAGGTGGSGQCGGATGSTGASGTLNLFILEG